LEENLKYKSMFNVLQDPILLVKGKEIIFKNTLAQDILGEADSQDEEPAIIHEL